MIPLTTDPCDRLSSLPGMWPAPETWAGEGGGPCPSKFSTLETEPCSGQLGCCPGPPRPPSSDYCTPGTSPSSWGCVGSSAWSACWTPEHHPAGGPACAFPWGPMYLDPLTPGLMEGPPSSLDGAGQLQTSPHSFLGWFKWWHGSQYLLMPHHGAGCPWNKTYKEENLPVVSDMWVPGSSRKPDSNMSGLPLCGLGHPLCCSHF